VHIFFDKKKVHQLFLFNEQQLFFNYSIKNNSLKALI